MDQNSWKMTKIPSSTDIKIFQNKILDWWKVNKRDFPWRNTENPYKIMVSEFMLQQTQTTRVIEKYNQFIKKFPTLTDLAQARKEEVFKLWSGLGYNRRALWLKEAAQKIVDMGYFPKNPDTLMKFRGIGKYSSRSILIFAFNLDIATVDTNIRRIFIHEGFANEDTSERELFQLANMLLLKNRSRDWHNALMDYAAQELPSRKVGIKPKTTQTKFKGSTREVRGKIIKQLLLQPSIKKSDIFKLFPQIPQNKIENIINSLKKDGLIVQKKDNLVLPK